MCTSQKCLLLDFRWKLLTFLMRIGNSKTFIPVMAAQKKMLVAVTTFTVQEGKNTVVEEVTVVTLVDVTFFTDPWESLNILGDKSGIMKMTLY